MNFQDYEISGGTAAAGGGRGRLVIGRGGGRGVSGGPQGRRSAVGHSKQIRTTIDKLYRKVGTLGAHDFQEIQDFSRNPWVFKKIKLLQGFRSLGCSWARSAIVLRGGRGSAGIRPQGRHNVLRHSASPGKPGAS